MAKLDELDAAMARLEGRMDVIRLTMEAAERALGDLRQGLLDLRQRVEMEELERGKAWIAALEKKGEAMAKEGASDARKG